MKSYKFYGTIQYSGYVVINAENEMEARKKAQHSQFERMEIPTLDRHFDFMWDNEDPEEIASSS